MRTAPLLLLVALIAAGCGQKGPLYLRDNPPAGIKPPKPEPYTPVPYPQDAGRQSQGEAAGGTKK